MDTTWLIWERSKIQTLPNHYNCSEEYQCRLLKQYRKIQGETEYLGHKFSAVHECFFNPIHHMDYHPSKHVTPNPQSSRSSNHGRSRRRACPSCKTRQYFDLNANEMKYLSKLKDALQRVNRKLHNNIMKTHPRVTSKRVKKPSHHSHRRSHSRQKWFSLLTWLSCWGVYMNVRNIRKIKQNLQICKSE